MEILCKNAAETEKLAETISKKLTGGSVLALYGDLGAGKTTFTAFLCKALGFVNRVQSPTFVIHRIYKNTDGLIKTVHHLDLYRLTSPEEVLELGIDELMTEKSSILVIEWPEIAKELLPPQTIRIYFEATGENFRRVDVQNLP